MLMTGPSILAARALSRTSRLLVPGGRQNDDLAKQHRHGVANWTSSTSYPTVGALAANGGNCYQVVVPGTSADVPVARRVLGKVVPASYADMGSLRLLLVLSRLWSDGQYCTVSGVTSGNVRVNMATPTVVGNWYVEVTTPVVSAFESFGIVMPSWLANDPNSTPGDLTDGVAILGPQGSGTSIWFNSVESGNACRSSYGRRRRGLYRLQRGTQRRLLWCQRELWHDRDRR